MNQPIYLSPRQTARLALAIGVALSCIIMLWVYTLYNGTNPFLLLRPGKPTTSMTFIVVVSILISMGLGTLGALVTANRHRFRAVLRPSIGRVISAVIMALITPFNMLMFTPAFLFWAAMFSDAPLTVPFATGLTLLFFIVWYPISCLIISGIKRRFLRVAVFTQLWVTTFCLIMFVTIFARASL